MNSKKFYNLVKTSSNGQSEEEILLIWLDYAKMFEEAKDALIKGNLTVAKSKISLLACKFGDEYGSMIGSHSKIKLPNNEFNPFHQVHLELSKELG